MEHTLGEPVQNLIVISDISYLDPLEESVHQLEPGLVKPHVDQVNKSLKLLLLIEIQSITISNAIWGYICTVIITHFL